MQKDNGVGNDGELDIETSTFSLRSRSVLPPIKTTRNSDNKQKMLTLKSPMARRGSFDQGMAAELSSRQNFDMSSNGNSVYKLDPHYAEPQKTISQGLTRDRLMKIGAVANGE